MHGGRFHQAGKAMAIEPSTFEQFLRGAVISVLSIWEHYVLNLFSEAFNHVVHVGDGTNTPEYSSDDNNGSQHIGTFKELRKIRKEWPGCQKMIQDAIKRRGASKRRPLEVVAFNLLTSASPHLRLLEEHRDHVLRGCTPLLLGDGGINETFNSLFAMNGNKKSKNHRLSQSIRLLGISYSFISSSGENGLMSFQSVETINDVLRLYYGARCIFSHGLPSRTLNEGTMELEDGVGYPPAARDLIKLYNQLKTSGRKGVFTYLDRCMMYRFFFRLANRLMVAVAMELRDASPKAPPLWNLDNYFASDMVVTGPTDVLSEEYK